MVYAPRQRCVSRTIDPACDPGLSAAATAIPGVVFAGAFDGHLRAYDSSNGEILWDFNTNAEFASVSGETAAGGSIESDGPVIYRGHVLINSGYLFGDRMAGNAFTGVCTTDRSLTTTIQPQTSQPQQKKSWLIQLAEQSNKLKLIISLNGLGTRRATATPCAGVREISFTQHITLISTVLILS